MEDLPWDPTEHSMVTTMKGRQCKQVESMDDIDKNSSVCCNREYRFTQSDWLRTAGGREEVDEFMTRRTEEFLDEEDEEDEEEIKLEANST